MTFSTCGWLARYSTIFLVFSAWRSTRRLRVSTPCSNRNALNGLMVAPVSYTHLDVYKRQPTGKRRRYIRLETGSTSVMLKMALFSTCMGSACGG